MLCFLHNYILYIQSVTVIIDPVLMPYGLYRTPNVTCIEICGAVHPTPAAKRGGVDEFDQPSPISQKQETLHENSRKTSPLGTV